MSAGQPILVESQSGVQIQQYLATDFGCKAMSSERKAY